MGAFIAMMIVSFGLFVLVLGAFGRMLKIMRAGTIILALGGMALGIFASWM